MPLALAPGSYGYSMIEVAIVAQVAAALGISTTFVRPVANDDYVITEAENLFAYIMSYGVSPIDARTGERFPDSGAGRYCRIGGRRFRVYTYTRQGVDVTGGDEVALGGLDPTVTVNTPPVTPGGYMAEELVFNALDDFLPLAVINTQTVVLTVGCIHWIGSDDGPPIRAPEDDKSLVRSHTDFQAVYILSMNVGAIAPPLPPPPVLVNT